MGIPPPWANTYLHNLKPTYLNHKNKQVELGKIDLNPINKLIMTSETTQPATSPRPSTNPREDQSRIYDLDTFHRQFSNTPEDKFQDQWTLTQ